MFTNIIEKISDFIFNRFYCWYSNQQYTKLVLSLKKDLEIYQLIEDLSNEIKADRIILMYLHNGGGSIVPGKPKFSSAVTERVSDDYISSRKEDFQKIVVSDRYLLSIVNMLFDENSMIIRDTKFLNQSRIRDTLELDGIQSSIIAYVASNNDNIWYLNINFKREVDLNLNKIDKISSCRNKIANILEQYFTLTHRA
jgi:hypothetical protein